MAWPSVGCAFDAGSGILLILLAGAVALVKPRRAINWALVAYSAGWGLFVVLANLNERLDCGVQVALPIA